MKTIIGYIIAAVVFVALGSCYLNTRAWALRAEGALTLQTSLWNKERDSLRSIAPELKTVFVDRVRTLEKLDTLYRDKLITVTNNITDTITVREYIAIADSTIGACRAALSACSLLNTNLATQLVLSDSVINAQRRMIPRPVSWLGRTARNVEHVLAIVGAGTIAFKIIRD
jgi:hypothetical protein